MKNNTVTIWHFGCFGFGHRVIARRQFMTRLLDGNLPANQNIRLPNRNAVNARDEKGLQTLHLCSNQRHDDVVRVCWIAGQTSKRKNADGYTFFATVCIMGKEGDRKTLLERKAKIDAQDNDQIPRFIGSRL